MRVTMPKNKTTLILLLYALLLTACAPTAPTMEAPTATPIALVTALLPTETTIPAPTPTPAPETPTPSPTQITLPRLCAPLQDLPLEGMEALISNPYHPPRPGYDDPHAGIDLAVRLPDSQVAVSGHPVQAAIAGQVAMVVQNRFPFGNALVIETPLDAFPADWWSAAEVPEPAPTLPPLSALTCPPGPELSIADPNRRSLYILYAHLQSPPALQMGDTVSCGQVIGTVGESGNALNPHLHFESRVAPSGLRLTGMSHYDAGANAEEMSSYCLWSVSGLFQLVDPRNVLRLEP